ncbi:hypothetical protein JCM19297_655 [Nonlabens ulvanivorans]|nr:hypothetical protein JCM19297_655 [Nonlabens ulvanivorans]
MMRIIKLLTLLVFAATITTSCGSQKPIKKSATAGAEKKKPKKGGIQPYAKVITKDAKSDEGLFTVHQVEDKYFYEIPDSLFNREMLMVTRIAKTAAGLGFGGGKQNTETLRWQRKNDNVLLRVVSHQVVAADSLPVSMAVENSNFELSSTLFLLKR